MTGSGTALDPYVIWDVNDLQDMNLDRTAYYELGQDIDASITVTWNAGAGFIPIGNGLVHFTGHFDGKTFTISSLFINRPATTYQALFGRASGGATIANVTLTDLNITGDYNVAGIVGYCDTVVITNCHTAGAIRGITGWSGGISGYSINSTTANCHSDALITGGPNADSVGGLIGWHRDSTLTNSYATGDVTVAGGDNYDIGGLVGDHDGTSTMADCYATGHVTVSGVDIYDIGGLAGDQGAVSVIRCYSTGNVTVTSTADVYDCGGLVGCNAGIIERCYATGNLVVTSNDNDISDFGGLTGDNSGLAATISQSYCTGSVSISVSGGGVFGTRYVGAFTGDNSGLIDDCYCRGNVSVDDAFGGVWVGSIGGFSGDNWRVGARLRHCYSTGLVTATAGIPDVGGFVGRNSTTVTSCFWDTQTSGMTTSAGATGKTTAEMKRLATFLGVGWDILARSIDKNNGYPYLAWQSTWYILVTPTPAPISVVTLAATEIR